MTTTEKSEMRKALRQGSCTPCREPWPVSWWSLRLARWPKGVHMERMPLPVGALNTVVMLFIQSD